MKGKALQVLLYSIALLALMLFTPRETRADDVNFTVNVDTSSLIGNPNAPFEIGFALLDASGTADMNNTVDVTDFSFGTGGSGGAVDPSITEGGGSGDLTSGIDLVENGSDGLNGIAAFFTPGSTLSFLVSMSTNPTAPGSIDPSLGQTGDEFVVLIFQDNATSEVATTDPSGNDFLVDAEINPNGVGIEEYKIAAPVATPEPGTLLLLLCGIGALGFGLLRKRSVMA
ncbi:MAG TPA: NF038129 family PEP-CTERM protein [Candidatus Aquilonibacter sp.]|nr:NF038129 family PEP-CTERM protein [Candidatus Aquilonibacter sp.]